MSDGVIAYLAEDLKNHLEPLQNNLTSIAIEPLLRKAENYINRLESWMSFNATGTHTLKHEYRVQFQGNKEGTYITLEQDDLSPTTIFPPGANINGQPFYPMVHSRTAMIAKLQAALYSTDWLINWASFLDYFHNGHIQELLRNTEKDKLVFSLAYIHRKTSVLENPLFQGSSNGTKPLILRDVSHIHARWKKYEEQAKAITEEYLANQVMTDTGCIGLPMVPLEHIDFKISDELKELAGFDVRNTKQPPFKINETSSSEDFPFELIIGNKTISIIQQDMDCLARQIDAIQFVKDGTVSAYNIDSLRNCIRSKFDILNMQFGQEKGSNATFQEFLKTFNFPDILPNVLAAFGDLEEVQEAFQRNLSTEAWAQLSSQAKDIWKSLDYQQVTRRQYLDAHLFYDEHCEFMKPFREALEQTDEEADEAMLSWLKDMVEGKEVGPSPIKPSPEIIIPTPLTYEEVMERQFPREIRIETYDCDPDVYFLSVYIQEPETKEEDNNDIFGDLDDGLVIVTSEMIDFFHLSNHLRTQTPLF